MTYKAECTVCGSLKDYLQAEKPSLYDTVQQAQDRVVKHTYVEGDTHVCTVVLAE